MATIDNKNKPAAKRNYLRLGEILISAGMLTEKELEILGIAHAGE